MKTQTDVEVIIKVLTRVQKMYRTDVDKNGERVCYGLLLWEDWDWLVVMQCLQDHGLFKNNPKRPPLKAFVEWIEELQVPQIASTCCAKEMSLASRELRGARYPWNGESWEPYVLVRWRMLYKTLDEMLTK